MTIRAYDESYLNDAMNNLGDMFDYALCSLKYQAELFYAQFIVSGVARNFEIGNPKYIAGLSGPELVNEILWRTENIRQTVVPSQSSDKTPEYWAGWILAYYQWYSACRFDYLNKQGLSFSRILALYPTLHEADVSKFLDIARTITSSSKANGYNALKNIRQSRHMTQKKLSELSGVSLRMIQLYEQNKQDIKKAESQSVVHLANILGCSVNDLIEQ